VTARRIRDLQRELTAVAEPFGARLVDIQHTGSSHLRATIACGAATLDVFAALTPSDWRANKQQAAFVRRRLRKLTGGNNHA
jgi:hypothetical protein